MFFPRITRRSDYERNGDNGFYSYPRYRRAIEEDCQFRCVYCDVAFQEGGMEGFHLDHFRPQHRFPEIRNSPFNLVLACPACNTSKSKDWPDDEISEIGYIDPFENDRRDYFIVEGTGELRAARIEAEYSIEALKLNRLTRVQLRRRRIISAREKELYERVLSRVQGGISQDDAKMIREILSDLI